MDVLMGAMSKLAPKLLQLLGDEYKLQKGVRKKVEFVLQELESNHSALRKVAEVPWDQLDEQVQVWARQVREASYDMDDILDSFLVRVEGREPGPGKESWLKHTLKNMSDLFGKVKARHNIAGSINDIEKQLHVVAQRRERSRVDMIVAKPDATLRIDPRLIAMHTEVTQLIGIAKSSSELISKLSLQEDNANNSNGKTKIVSVVGVGGLGKTTLAKAVYDQLKPRFGCGAFVPVGRNADLKKLFRDVLIDLDKETYMNVKYDILDVRQLINELRDFLGSRRYFIVIDDVWDATTWKTIKSAFDQQHSGSRVITTTRKREVSSSEDECTVREFQVSSSVGSEAEGPTSHPEEASEKILHKCGGIPLAMITMASLLVGKSREEWFDVCNSPGFYGGMGNQQVDDTEWILSLSYYDLPPNLKACLLYLSVYPEDTVIEKGSLILRWIAEGFIERKPGTSLFERGEEYFHELINRSMIQLVEVQWMGVVHGCRVHDMVLDLIRGLSDKENFVTIVSNSNADQGTSPSPRNKVRRLAYHKRMMKEITEHTRAMAAVRSLVASGCDIESWVLHPRFELLRVLALDECRVPSTFWQQGLKHIGNLLHLRYLGLRDMFGGSSYELPEEIGKLKFLQTLDVCGFGTRVLPLGVCQLTQLVCLRGAESVEARDGLLTKLKLLEVLEIDIDDLNDESKLQFMKDLGNLSEARVLLILGRLNEEVQSELVQSLGKLHKLQSLGVLENGGRHRAWSGEWGTVVLPRHLRELFFSYYLYFHRVPSWISAVHFPNLSSLCLSLYHLDEAGLRAIGGLPELRSLTLQTPRLSSMASSSAEVNITAGDGLFKNVRMFSLTGYMFHLVLDNEDPTSVSLSIWNNGGGVAFGRSRIAESDQHSSSSSRRSVAPTATVMPYLEKLSFHVPVRSLYTDGNGSCDNLGLQCLPSGICCVEVYVNCEGASAGDVEKAVAALREQEKHIPVPISIHFFGDQSGAENEGQISSPAGDQVAVTPSG